MSKAAGRGKYDRSQTTRERRHQRRQQLLDSATEVFAQRGYAATRVDDIVDHAGISRRTLYEDFESVEHILVEIFDRAVRISFATIIERLRPVVDPIERIHVGIAAYYETIAANPAAARVVFEEYRNAGPSHAARFELNTTRYTLLLLESLSAAHAAGRLARPADELGVYALTKGLEAVAVRAIHRGEHHRLAEVAPIMANLILDAFRASP